jgi:hypothetical protein
MTKFSAIGKLIERNAEKRREQAVEHRDEPRHVEAAKILDSLAAQFAAGDVDAEIWDHYRRLERQDGIDDEAAQIIGSVGFDAFPQTPDQLLQAIIELVEENRA